MRAVLGEIKLAAVCRWIKAERRRALVLNSERQRDSFLWQTFSDCCGT